ncbi:MAG: CopD family protein [Aeromicrobium sp.]
MTLDTRRPAVRRPRAPRMLAGRTWVVVALIAMVLGAWIGASLPHRPPVGIPDPGLITRWGLPVATVVRDVSVSALIGLLVIAVIMRSDLAASTRRSLDGAARVAAVSTTGAVVALYLLTASDVYSIGLGAALDPDRVAALYDETDIGQRLGQQVVLWVLISGVLVLARPAGRAVALGLALVALVPWAYGGHAAGSGSHQLAVYSILLHLVGVTVWFGGVTAMVWLTRLEPLRTVTVMRRFSPVALVAFAVVAVSGVAATWIRLPEVSALWVSGYGRLIIAKAALLVVLGGFGVWHRRRVLANVSGERELPTATVLRVVAVEALVMAGTMGLAVALSRTPMG